MKSILIMVVTLLVITAIYSEGLLRSLAELSAFSLVLYFIFRIKSADPRS